MFVITKVSLSQQNFCHKKNFVATSILLSQQKTCFVATNRCLSWQTGVCHNKTFVMTKMILVAALTKDRTAPPVKNSKTEGAGRAGGVGGPGGMLPENLRKLV